MRDNTPSQRHQAALERIQTAVRYAIMANAIKLPDLQFPIHIRARLREHRGTLLPAISVTNQQTRINGYALSSNPLANLAQSQIDLRDDLCFKNVDLSRLDRGRTICAFHISARPSSHDLLELHNTHLPIGAR